MAEIVRNPAWHGDWQIGDRCCYWWMTTDKAVKVHMPSTVINLTKTRIVIKPDGADKHRSTTARFLEPAHTCNNSVGREGMAQLCLLPAGHKGDCA